MHFSWLEKYNFNVGNVMGSIQREMEKVGFNTLDKIREAYVVAFGSRATAEVYSTRPGLARAQCSPAVDLNRGLWQGAGGCGSVDGHADGIAGVGWSRTQKPRRAGIKPRPQPHTRLPRAAGSRPAVDP